MRSFTDSKNRTWEIVMDPFTFARVKEKLGVDLYDPGNAIEQLAASPPAFINALYILCGDQTEGKVTDREFCRGMNGDVIEAARDAFLDELLFFSRSETKPTIARLIAAQKELTRRVSKLAIEKTDRDLDGLDLDALALKVAEKLNGSPGTSPASSESSLAVSPSASSS